MDSSYLEVAIGLAKLEQRQDAHAELMKGLASNSDVRETNKELGRIMESLQGVTEQLKEFNQITMPVIARKHAEGAFTLMKEELDRREELARQLAEQNRINWRAFFQKTFVVLIGPVLILLVNVMGGADGSEAVQAAVEYGAGF